MSGFVERGGGFAGEGEEADGASGLAGQDRRRLLEDNVGVGAADAEGSDPGATGAVRAGPFGQFIDHL